tara:strand:+ start:786 stop:932 length:147 start_codon:yes stop_codon:yes gene_type:complete
MAIPAIKRLSVKALLFINFPFQQTLVSILFYNFQGLNDMEEENSMLTW